MDDFLSRKQNNRERFLNSTCPSHPNQGARRQCWKCGLGEWNDIYDNADEKKTDILLKSLEPKPRPENLSDFSYIVRPVKKKIKSREQKNEKEKETNGDK